MNEERRKKMDNETRDEFAKVNKTLSKINLSVEKNLSYNQGLDLPKRMTKAEEEIETKASWKGLYLAVLLIVSILVVAIAIAKGIN